MIVVCAQAQAALKKDLVSRRVGQPGLRDARPKRIQRLETVLTRA
jgi:hypothetical protein